MFEGLIASILNRFFSGYIDEIDYKNLQIGLISGSVELKNLSLKPDAFFQFDVPIEVKCSRVRRLNVRVPWRSIYSEPVVISIEDVHVLIAPMSITNVHDPEKVTQVSVAAKRKQVKQLNRGILIDEQQVDQGFFKTLFDTVLNNIKIQVKNIHVRYEDSTSLPAIPISIGFVLEEVLVTTTDKDGKQIQLDSEAEFVFKIGQVKCCNIYFNALHKQSQTTNDVLLINIHDMSDNQKMSLLQKAISESSILGYNFQSIFVSPLSASATLKLNRFRHKQSLTKPHISMNTELLGIDVKLSMDQLLSAKALIDHYRITLRNSNYVKYRPKSEVKEDVRAWWKYAYRSIVEERIRSYNWERMKLYRDQYRQYKNLYKQALESKAVSDSLAKEMDILEFKLNLPTIMIARQHAKIEGKHDVKDAVYKLTIDEKEELYNMIGFNEHHSPDDCALTELYAQLLLHSVSFSLENKDVSLLRLELSSISSELSIQPTIKSGDFRFDFDRLSVDMENGKGKKVTLLRSIEHSGGGDDDDDSDLDKFMHFDFKKHSVNSDSIADYDVSFGFMPVEFIYEYEAINNILAALKSSAVLEMITSAATYNFAKLSNYSTAGLIYAIENHKRFNLNALVYSPIIIIPQKGTRGGNGIITYLGKVELTSDLTPYNVNDHSKISRNMYDTFNLHLTNAQILMCETSSAYLFTKTDQEKVGYKILQPANLDAILLLSIRPSCHSLPQLVLKSNINNIDFNLSDQIIIALHRFLIDIPVPAISSVNFRGGDGGDDPSPKYEEDVFYDPSLDTLSNSLKRPSALKRDSSSESSTADEVLAITTDSEVDDDIWSSCFLGEHSSYTVVKENYTKYMLEFNMRKATVHVNELKSGPYLRLGMEKLQCDLAVTAFGAAGAISLGALKIIDVPNRLDILETSEDDLITLKYRFISNESPSYGRVYQSLPHYAKFTFNNLCFVCRQEFMIKLIRFGTSIMKRIAKQSVAKASSAAPKDRLLLISIGGGRAGNDVSPKVSIIKSHLPPKRPSGSTAEGQPLARIECSFNMFAWRVVRKDVDIATLLIQGLSIEAGLKDNMALYTQAALKDIAVRRTPRGVYADIVNLLDDNVFDASLEYADKSLSCNVTVGRMRIVFIYNFYKELLDFINLLSSVNTDLTKTVLNQAKETVYRQLEDVNVFGESIKQDLLLRVHVNAPSIIVPRNGLSRHAFMIRMGTLDVTNDELIETSDMGKGIYIRFNLSLQSVDACRVYVASDDTIEIRENVLLPIGFTVNVSLLQKSKSKPPDARFVPIKIFSRLDLIQIEISLPSTQLMFAILDDNILAAESPIARQSVDKIQGSSTIVFESGEPKTIANTNDAQISAEESTKASMELEFLLLLVGLSVKIIETTTQTEASIGDVCLLTVSTSMVVVRAHYDDTIDAEITIGSLSVKDVRANSNLAVRDMIEPVDETKTGEEDRFFYCVIRFTIDKDLIITFKLDKLKINMCLPFLLYLQRFVMNTVFYAESGILFDAVSEGGHVIKLIDENIITAHHKFASKPKTDFDALTYGEPSITPSSSLRSISIYGNLDLPDVAILAQPTIMTSQIILLKSCCVLKFNQTMIPDFNSTCSLSLKDLTLSLIDHSEATLTILKPCNSTLEFERTEKTRNDLYVNFTFSQVQINLTASVYNAIVDVLSTISDAGIARNEVCLDKVDHGEIKEPFCTQTINKQKYEEILEARKRADEGVRYPNLVKIAQDFQRLAADFVEVKKRLPIEQLTIEMKDVFLIYSEETQNELVPLMIALISIKANAHDWSRRLTAVAHFDLECSYYNDTLAVWEPFIEPLMIVEDRYRPWKFEFWFTSGEALCLMDSFEKVSKTFHCLFKPYINSITLGSGDSDKSMFRPIALPSSIPTATFLKLCSDDILSVNLTPVAMRLLYRLIRVITRTSEKVEQGKKELKPFLEIWNHTGLSVNIQLSRNVKLNPDVIHNCTTSYFDERPNKRVKKHIEENTSTYPSGGFLSPLMVFQMMSQRSAMNEDDISDDLRKYRFNILFVNLSEIRDLSFRRSGTLIKTVFKDRENCPYLIFVRISRHHSAESISLCSPTKLCNGTRVCLRLFCRRKDDFPEYLQWNFEASCFPDVYNLACLEPDDTYEVPVSVIYHCELLVAPDDPRYEPVRIADAFFEMMEDEKQSLKHFVYRPEKPVHSEFSRFWPRTGGQVAETPLFESKLLTPSNNLSGFFFRLDIRKHDNPGTSVAQYRFPPRLLTITPSITITNALPFDIKFDGYTIESGSTLNYHTNKNLIQVSAEFLYDNKPYVANVNHEPSTITSSVKFINSSKDDNPIHLNICQMNLKNTLIYKESALLIAAPYWLHNQTGLDLELKAHDYKGTVQLPASMRQRIFGYPFSRKGRVKICLASSGKWSDAFNIDTIGVVVNVLIYDKNGRNYEVTCKITYSNTGFTRIVQFLPIYMLVNKSELSIQIKDPLPDSSMVVVPNNQSQPFWPTSSPLLSLRLNSDEQPQLWTSVSLMHCMSTVVKLASHGLTVSVGVPPGAKVILKKFSFGDSPVKLRNLCSNLTILFTQASESATNPLILNPYQSVYYIWPDSALTKSLFWSPTIVADSNDAEVRLKTPLGKPSTFLAVFDRDETGYCPIVLSDASRAIVYWISSYEDVQRVLTFTDDRVLFEILKQPDLATLEISITLNALKVSLINDIYEFGLLSCQGSEARWALKTKDQRGKDVTKVPSSQASADWLEYNYRQTIIDDDSSTGNRSEQKCNRYVIDFVDMSVKEPDRGVLVRTNKPAIDICYRQSAVCMAARLVMWNTQVDNQLTDAYFKLVFYPIIDDLNEQTPFIDVHFVITLKDNMYIVRSGKVSISQLCLNVDKGFLCTALRWLESWKMHEENLQMLTQRRSSDVKITVSTDKLIFTAEDADFRKLVAQDVALFFERASSIEGELSWFQDLRIVIESFSIDSISLRMSFSLDSSSPRGIEDDELIQALVGTFGNALTIHIGKAVSGFNDVPFNFKRFSIERRTQNFPSLLRLFQNFYMLEAIKQAYVVIFGLNLFGNPYGLLKQFSDVIGKSLYDPLVESIKAPTEAKANLSHTWKEIRNGAAVTVSSAANSVSLITDYAGRALASFSFDKSYKTMRYQRMRQQRVDNMPGALKNAGRVFVSGWARGIRDLIDKPSEEREQVGGATGVGKGIYKGLVGLVVKPTGGIFDSASIVFSTLSRLTNPAKMITSQRLTRTINPDLGLQPYTEYGSKGAAILRTIQIENNIDNSEFYWTHLFLSDRRCLLVTDRRIYLLIPSKHKLLRQWKIGSTPIDISSLLKVSFRANADAEFELILERKMTRILAAGEHIIGPIQSEDDVRWICLKLNTVIRLEVGKEDLLV